MTDIIIIIIIVTVCILIKCIIKLFSMVSS